MKLQSLLLPQRTRSKSLGTIEERPLSYNTMLSTLARDINNSKLEIVKEEEDFDDSESSTTSQDEIVTEIEELKIQIKKQISKNKKLSDRKKKGLI